MRIAVAVILSLSLLLLASGNAHLSAIALLLTVALFIVERAVFWKKIKEEKRRAIAAAEYYMGLEATNAAEALKIKEVAETYLEALFQGKARLSRGVYREWLKSHEEAINQEKLLTQRELIASSQL